MLEIPCRPPAEAVSPAVSEPEDEHGGHHVRRGIERIGLLVGRRHGQDAGGDDRADYRPREALRALLGAFRPASAGIGSCAHSTTLSVDAVAEPGAMGAVLPRWRGSLSPEPYSALEIESQSFESASWAWPEGS